MVEEAEVGLEAESGEFCRGEGMVVEEGGGGKEGSVEDEVVEKGEGENNEKEEGEEDVGGATEMETGFGFLGGGGGLECILMGVGFLLGV